MSADTRVRCYSCSHIYVADIGSIDTRCPECRSDSFTTHLTAQERNQHAQ
jgi:predicted Zn-ribbon and HTH transcriptional regulator